MSATDLMMSYKRRKTFSRTINNWSEETIFRVSIAVGMTFVFILVLPFILIALPFILAWDFSGALVAKINEEQVPKELFNNKWGKFNVDFNSWEKTEEE